MSRAFHSSYLRALITSTTLAVLAILFGPIKEVPASGGLQAAYAFSEGSGATAEDLSGNANIATLQNDVAWTESGRFGNGLSLDGVDDVVEVANSSTLSPTSAITLGAWVRTERVASQSVFYKSGSANPPYALKLHSAGSVAAQLQIGGQTHYVGSETRYLTSEWIYVTVTYDGSTIRLYLNGQLEGSEAASGAIATSSGPLLLGGEPIENWLNGRIDEVRLYSRALSQAEIWADMFGPVDATSPLTVTFQEPAANARVLTTATLAATFGRAMNSSSISTSTIQLRDSALNPVAATVSVDAVRHRAQVIPSSPLTPGVTYTLTVQGGSSGVLAADGGTMVEDVAWSVTVAGVDGAPVAAWNFDEGSGMTSADLTGNANTAALVDGAGWTTAGHSGAALLLDGLDAAAQAADSPTLNPVSSLTFTLWTRPSQVATQYLLYKGQSWGLKLHSSGTAVVLMDIGGAVRVLQGETSYAANEWVHLAATYDGTTMRLYVNGVEDAAQAESGAIATNADPLWMGTEAGLFEWFSGRVDDVRIYERALAAAEVVEDMTSSVGDISPPSVTSTSPIADAIDVAVNANVSAAFSEAIDATTLAPSTFELRNPGGQLVSSVISYSPATRTATLNPNSDLAEGTLYTVTLRGGTSGPRVRDLANNALVVDYTWSFRTIGGGPTVTSLEIFPRGMSLSIGGSHQFTATAHFSDGTRTSVTDSASWQSSATNVASVNTSGRVAATAAGETTITVSHQGHVSSATVSVYEGESIPPDPADVAPSLDPTVVTLLADATAFLHTGENPIQRNVVSGTIQPHRTAVIRGKVMTQGGQPLSGVRATIVGHAEFGHTLTRLDGGYDLVVNGGGSLTIHFEKNGLLPIERTLQVPWGRYVVAADVALVSLDPNVTIVDLNASIPIQVARGSTITDDDGTRRATVLIPQGTTAALVMPDGTQQPLDELHIRATEYTVGPRGQSAMPAPLPPTSGYTYAVELSADEALAAGATSVTFGSPIPLYVENFLGFSVGTLVPSGYYDWIQRAWTPSENGVVIRVLSIDGNGRAELDTNADGLPEDAMTLSAIGVTDDERQTLATTYAAGQSVWRVPIDHFTPWDLNWFPFQPSDVDPDPNPEPPREDEKSDCTQHAQGSIIECQSQVLGERVPVSGTSLALNYRSDRVPGRLASRTVDIPLTESVLPASVTRIDLDVSVGGRRFQQSYAPTVGQVAQFVWDGLDAYGRPVEGRQPVAISINYVYDVVYAGPEYETLRPPEFGRPSFVSRGVPGRGELSVPAVSSVLLGTVPRFSASVAGWSLDGHHVYDPEARILFLGDGRQRAARSLGRVVRTRVAASGTSPVVSQDGSVYFVGAPIAGGWPVMKSSPTGQLTTLTTLANYPQGLGADDDGSVYYPVWQMNWDFCAGADAEVVSIIRRSPSGEISGASAQLPFDASCEATLATLTRAPGGAFYLVAGRFVYRWSGAGTTLELVTRLTDGAGWVAAGSDGVLFLLFANTSGPFGLHVDRLAPDGQMTRFAGTGTYGFSGDGGLAAQANLAFVDALAVGGDGSLLIVDRHESGTRLRRVAADGTIATIAGGENSSSEPVPDGSPATALSTFGGVSSGPEGSIYVGGDRIYELRPAFGSASDGLIRIASDDGAEIYEFDQRGRHLRTLNAWTNAVIQLLAYNATGGLVEIENGDGQTIQIERDPAGAPTAIVAPFGQRMTLGVDQAGYLARIDAPGGITNSFISTTDGLLTRFTDGNGRLHQFSYDGGGRLTVDSDPADGSQTLTRTLSPRAWLTTRTTQIGRVRSYLTEVLPEGGQKLTVTEADGTESIQTSRADGTFQSIADDGTLAVTEVGGDPRFGLQAPVRATLTTTTPAGLTMTTSTTRSATFANPQDLTTLLTQTDTAVVNGRAYQRVFEAATRTFTLTTPAGRTSTTTIDHQGRVTRLQTGTLTPVDFAYDPQGHLTALTQGLRQSAIAYDASGRISTMTDPLARTVTFGYDAGDRVTTQTLPGARVLEFAYDANGNITAITPPDRPAHSFTYTPVDRAASYAPPSVPVTGSTTYGFNADRQPTTIARPDGQTIAFGYGTTSGRLTSVTFSRGQLQYGYDNAGRVSTLTDPDGVNLTFTYDGELPLSETWSGALTGSVSRTFTNNFDLATERVNGAHEVGFGYDDDRLLTQAGALAITRHAQNGLVTATTVGSANEAFEYNGLAN